MSKVYTVGPDKLFVGQEMVQEVPFLTEKNEILGGCRVKNNQHTENEVLFQKMGNRWYVFTEVGNEFLYAPLPEGVDPRSTKLELCQIIEEHMAKVVRHAQREVEPAAA